MDGGAAARIAKAVLEGSSQDEPLRVLEIGPGTGALTEQLIAYGAAVTAIDIDANMIGILQSRAELRAATIIEADALAFDYAAFGRDKPWRMAGNLPYNIATPLITNLIEMGSGPEQIVVMVQKDVAARMAARPSTPAYGSLSIAVQYGMRIERLFTLGPSVFYPRPKIDSTVIRLTRHREPPVRVIDTVFFFRIVRAAFAYRRKTLANSLAFALGEQRERVTAALRAAGISEDVRGEALSIEQFAALSNALHE